MININIIKEKTTAVHVATGTMRGPITYQSDNLDHLGLVAAMVDELGIVELTKCSLTAGKVDFRGVAGRRINSARDGITFRPATRSWRYAQKETPYLR